MSGSNQAGGAASGDDAHPNPLAELIALATPERLLRDARATGEGVRVCVVDSGVDRAALEARYAARGQALAPIAGGIFMPRAREPLPYDGRQSTPHGTTVADIIYSIAPRVQLFSADVLGPLGSCDVEEVIAALRWAVDVWHCHIVNLSLGVPENRLQPLARKHQLLSVIEECYFRDVLVVAAAHNDHPVTRSYPARFAPPLVSVDKRDCRDPLEIIYRLREHVEFQAHGRGEWGPFAQELATSWAAPHVTGLAARLLTLRPGLKPFEIKTLLYWIARATGPV